MAAALSTDAAAGDLKITPTLRVEDSFTDNARNGPHGQEQADFFSRVSPGVTAVGTGARLNFNLSYNLNAQTFIDNTDLNNVRHQLAATGTAELLREFLFVDARASISDAVINSAGAISATVDTTNPANVTTLQTYSFSPYLRNHFGGFASTELRYTFADTESSALSSSVSNRGTVTVNSGEDFARSRWNVVGDVSHADRSGLNSAAVGGTLAPGQKSSSDNRTVDGQGAYLLDYSWALLAGIGYQDTRDTTLVKPFTGPTGNLGFKFTPSPRTSMTLTVTHRNDSTYPTFDLQYKITERTSLRASYTESVLTSEAQRVGNLDFFTVDQFGNFVDSRTAQAFQLNNNAFNLNNNALRRKTGDVLLTTSNDRNVVSANFNSVRSLTIANGIEQTVNALSFNWNRSINPTDSLVTTARFASTDFGTSPNRTDYTENVSVGYSHNFSPTLSGVIRYSGLFRQSNAAGGDLIDNIFSIGLTKQF